MKIRIYYEDTDLGGIVYHTNYIKYCERARSEHFFAKGMLPTEGERSGFVVRDLQAQFLATATLGDTIEVTTHMTQRKHTTIRLKQEIFKGDKKIFSMDILLVYISEGKPARIPKKFQGLFED